MLTFFVSVLLALGISRSLASRIEAGQRRTETNPNTNPKRDLVLREAQRIKLQKLCRRWLHGAKTRENFECIVRLGCELLGPAPVAVAADVSADRLFAWTSGREVGAPEEMGERFETVMAIYWMVVG